MVFGFGLRKKKQATIADVVPQLSPEAMAVLQEMMQQGPSGAVRSAAAPHFDPEAPTPETAAQIVPPKTVIDGDDTMPDETDPTLLASDTPPSRSARAERRRIDKAEKQRLAKLAKDEKIRAKRRKRAAKTSFSRTRYLREANGNAMTSIVAMALLLMVVLVGPTVLNTQLLMPKTAANLVIIAEIRALQSQIDQAKPVIASAIAQQSEREAEIGARLEQFSKTTSARSALLALLATLEQNGVRISPDTNRSVTTHELGVTGLRGQQMTISMQADFLNYLQVRNRFMEKQYSARITEEIITAEGDNPLVDIRVTFSIPALS